MELTENLKNKFLLNPFIWTSIGTGMLVFRSFIFGGGAGFITYFTIKSIYDKSYT